MKLFGYLLIAIVLLISCSEQKQNTMDGNYAIVIHGGAGTILKKNLTPEKEKAYQDALGNALKSGYEILKNGGSSLDAVETAIVIMEDCPLFNAGKGAVFTNRGKNEMDASIMDGKTLNAGAVSAVRHIRNPIKAARMVMDKSIHVMLTGKGAEEFAKSHHIQFEDSSYFYTEQRWNQLQHVIKSEDKQAHLDHSVDDKSIPESIDDVGLYDKKFGTVGAVALDQEGNLAAATSTGGMTNKRFGRVGDSPIIGSGTYANNNTCAVSATGHGEYFMRAVVSHDISAIMEYKGVGVKEAAEDVVMNKLVKLEGEGGVIAIDKVGNIATPFNSAGMYRGYIDVDGNMTIAIYKD